MRRLIVAVVVLCMAGIGAPPCLADSKDEKKDDKKEDKGALDTFEKEATDEETKTKQPEDSEDEDEDESDDSLFLTILEIPFYLTLAGGMQSWQRVDPPLLPDSFTPPRRHRGEPLIPFFCLDLTYQDVGSDVTALDARAEAGFGPFGIQARTTHYREESPDDDLDFTQVHGLYRMSVGHYAEIDLGFGVGILSGDQEHSGFSFAMPFTIQPIAGVGVGFRPSWTSIQGNSIGDYDLRLSIGLPFFTAVGGYRWVTTDGAGLDGPFVGGSVHF